MKSNSRLIIFMLIGVAVIALVVLFVFINKGEKKHDWSENYKTESTEPYGTNLITKLLGDYFGRDNFTQNNGKVLTKALGNQDSTGYRNLIFIGSAMALTEMETDTLLNFVANGNNALIIAKTIPPGLRSALKFTTTDDEVYELESEMNKEAQMNFYHPDLGSGKPYAFHYRYGGDNERYEWRYFNLSNFSDSIQSYARLGYILPSHPNFVRLAWGRGYFYFHVNPIVFTNYQLVQQTGLEYAEKVFSHLPRGKTLWDEHRKNLGVSSGKSRKHQLGPLSFILAQTPLRWGWYTVLVLIFLYFLFRAKRRQRIIPVILPNENTSLEFTQTVGALYFQQSDHQKLSLQKMRLFLLYIRNRYYLQTNVLDDQLVKKISIKSKVPLEQVERIFTLYKGFQNSVVEVDKDELITFHKALDNFYRNCK